MDNTTKEEPLLLSDILAIFLRNRIWYLLSVLVCLAVAFLVIKRTPAIYERHALVLIKTDGNTNRLMDEASMFSDLGISAAGYKVENELLIFKTNRLMTEVIRRRDLDVNYSIEGRFREFACYAYTPVKLIFPDSEDEQSFSLIMTPQKDHRIKLHDFRADNKRYTRAVIAHIGDTVSTPLGRVILEPNLNANPYSHVGTDIIVRKFALSKVAALFCSRLQTDMASKTSTIIKLSFTDTSPERAEDVLNTLVQVYDEDAIADKNRVAVSTERFISEQLDILTGELNDVDMSIAQYKSSNQLTDIASDASAYRSAVSSIEQRSADLHNQKSVAEFILDYIQKREGKGESEYDVIPNNVVVGNTLVEGLISEYNLLTLQREKLKLDAGVNNPQVEDLSNSINQMRQRIVASIRNLIQSLDIEIRNVERRGGLNTGRLMAVPTQQKAVTSVERQQLIKEQLYMYLLNKQQEASLAKCVTESNARVLDEAEGSNAPVKPAKATIMLCGLLVGLAIPTIILAILLYANTKIRTKKDLRSLSDIPFVGEIPQVKGTKWNSKVAGAHARYREDNRIVVTEKSHDAVSEAIKILRTNINLIGGKGHEPQVIMLTSFLPGAGKTFVSANLGMGMALASKKVVMVDIDIRRGSLGHGMNKDKAGITDYLGGYEDDVNAIIQHTRYHDNLDIITRGHKAPNPSELLMSERLDTLIESLRKMYDVIILDSVPVDVVADSMITNRVADLTLFVIRAGNLDKRLLPEISRLYEEKKLNNMTLVLNGISDSQVYGSGYGYGYGYGYSRYYDTE